MTSALEIDNQHKQGIILSELASWNRLEVKKIGKKRKHFMF